MPTNVEIKARISHPEALRQKLKALVPEEPHLLVQEDTFFHAPQRLKLRRTEGEEAQLIAYQRPDTHGPRTSTYTIAPVPHPEALHAVLAQALGVRGTVCKRRWLYLYDQTRIHLDEVEGLGTFLELEVVLHTEQSEEEGTAIARKLMEYLGIEEKDLIDRAYIDLLPNGDFPRESG